jgi:hypothetical protein
MIILTFMVAPPVTAKKWSPSIGARRPAGNTRDFWRNVHIYYNRKYRRGRIRPHDDEGSYVHQMPDPQTISRMALTGTNWHVFRLEASVHRASREQENRSKSNGRAGLERDPNS